MRGKKINLFSRAYSLFLKHFNSAAPALSSYAGPNFSAQYNQQTLAGHQTSMRHLCSPRTGISSFPSVVCQTLSLVRSVCRISKRTKVFPAGEAGLWQSAALVWRSTLWLQSNSKLNRIWEFLFCRDVP